MFKFLNKEINIESNNVVLHNEHWNAIFGLTNNESNQQDIKVLSNDLKDIFSKTVTTENIPVRLKTVVELTHLDNKEKVFTEAVVLGAGRDDFMVDFFAMDYVENKKLYKKAGTHNIALGGLSYLIDKIDDGDRDDLFAPDMCMYLPTQDKKFDRSFDFIGKVLSIEELDFKNEKLFVYKIQLISHFDDSNMFNLPIVVNPKNIYIENIDIGDMISGSFWMQGTIVD